VSGDISVEFLEPVLSVGYNSNINIMNRQHDSLVLSNENNSKAERAGNQKYSVFNIIYNFQDLFAGVDR
jgi:hypothetical protein